MSLHDAPQDSTQCTHCGQANDPGAGFCDGCGMELGLARQASQMTEQCSIRRVLLSQSLPTEELDRLWLAFERVSERPWFPRRVVWPSEDDGGLLLQELPEKTLLLSEATEVFKPGEPARAWLRLIGEVANAVEDIHRMGVRLNSLGLNSIILAEDTYEFVGLCMPTCLTHLDAPRNGIPLGGIDCCFAAPEVQGFVEYPSGAAADVYVLAALAYDLMSGERPRDLVLCGFSPVNDASDLGPSVKECLDDALALTPQRRPQSASQFVERLRKAIVKDCCRDGLTLRYACLTDIGLGGRDNNEDSCGIGIQAIETANGDCLVGVAAVADGMGGSAFGERASSLCIDRMLRDSDWNLEILGDALTVPAEWTVAFENWLLQLNHDMMQLGEQLAAPNDIGSTLTAVLFAGRRAFVLHAGDSRLYLLRQAQVSQFTHDQTYAEQMHSEGLLTRGEISTSIYRNVLTSYIGAPKLSPQVEELNLIAGDVLVLCSDGLMDGLNERDMHDLAVRLPPDEAVRELIRRSKLNLEDRWSDIENSEGIASSDNMTAIVIQLPEELPLHSSHATSANQGDPVEALQRPAHVAPKAQLPEGESDA